MMEPSAVSTPPIQPAPAPESTAPSRLPDYVAVDTASVRLVEMARKVAQTTSTVLILGESGTGKDQLAQLVHFLSPFQHEPIVKIDCSSLPAELVESELFGYEKGAFTGATQAKPGRLEWAGQGTLVLDEIAALAMPLQAKLLRVIEEKSFQRLGGRVSIRIGARLMALTNRDLRQAVAQGVFREDLYYRLYVVPLTIPRLSQRREDILPLAQHFLRQFRRTAASPGAAPGPELSLSPVVKAALLAYAFPGNVRELRNLLHRAAIYRTSGELGLADFPDFFAAASRRGEDDLRLSSMEKSHIAAVLQRFRGRKRLAAAALGISPKTLLEKRRRYGLDLPWTDRVPAAAAKRDPRRRPE